MNMPIVQRCVCVALLTFFSTSLPHRAVGQERDAFSVLGNEFNGVPVNQLLRQYEIDQLRPHFAARRAAVKAITTPEQFLSRQQAIRAKWMELIGPLPEKTPLNGRTVGTIARDGYVIEKVIYESRPGHHITANLYLPTERSGKIPGVLVPCGHRASAFHSRSTGWPR
jgi:hypothetical protein